MPLNLFSIYLGGILTFAVAIFHTRFYQLFRWKTEFEKVSRLNHKVFYTLHFALLLILFLLSALSLFYASELANCRGLAMGVNLILAIFWFWRAVWQVIYFNGKITHYLLIAIFSLLCLSYIFPVLIIWYN